MKENRKSPIHHEPVNKDQIKMLYMELGPSEAARRTGLKIGTVTKWASRYKWHRDKLIASIPAPRAGRPALNVSHLSQTPVKALEESHKELATETRSSLAQAAAKAAKRAAHTEIPVCSTAHLKDLAAAAARVFGWDQQQRSGDTYNTLVVTQEQLAMIRSLRQASLKSGDIGSVSQPDKEREEGQPT
jgi:HPt (histidine-containing phosphotransfer) domain-containing protein